MTLFLFVAIPTAFGLAMYTWLNPENSLIKRYNDWRYPLRPAVLADYINLDDVEV